MNESIELQDKTFVRYISSTELDIIVSRLADEINAYYSKFQLEIILVSILDGSFIFMADLVRKLTFPHKIHFVKLQSYDDMESTGQVKVLLDLDVDVSGKHVLIVEDIVDTGLTLESFKGMLTNSDPLSVKLCTLLSKPEVHNDIVDLDFVGKEIPPEFIIGYGLDLNGVARNLPDIYKLKI
jgi:hypoxanthine phosphoribosyltransferase